MDTNQLRCFISVAKLLNFTEAAKLNYVTQPALSRTIKELEKSLGVTLLYRTKHTVVLTDEGREFLKYAEETLQNERDMRMRFNSIAHGSSGTISIAMLPDVTDEFIACTSEFNSRFPSIQYNVFRYSGAEFETHLQSRDNDFYFATSASFAKAHSFNYIETHDEHYILAAHKSIVSKIDPCDVSTFERYSFAFISRNIGPIYCDSLMAFCQSINFSPKVMSYFNSAEATILAVEAGLGITIITGTCAHYAKTENVVLIPFHPEIPAFRHAIGWYSNSVRTTSEKYIDVIRSIYPESEFPLHKV